MRADAVLLAFALLATGCASLTPPAGQGMQLGYTPRVPSAPVLAQAPTETSSLAAESPPEPEAPQRLHRRRGARQDTTAVGPVPRALTVSDEPRGATPAREAVLSVLQDVKSTRDVLSRELPPLAARASGIGGANGLFIPYVTHGTHQLRWMDGALAGAATLADAAPAVSTRVRAWPWSATDSSWRRRSSWRCSPWSRR